MTAGFAITAVDLETAVEMLALGVESAGVARAVRSGGDTLLVGPTTWVDDSDYELREQKRLKVRSTGWAPAMVDIARGGDVPVFVHTHPHGSAMFSALDDGVDATLALELSRVAGCSTVASLVIAGTPDRMMIAGRRSTLGAVDLGAPETVRVAGPQPRLHLPPGSAPPSAAFDRQDRAYGTDGRRVLNALTIGIVGAGGTGSPTHEQAFRLGIGTVISVDDDVITESTPTRGYGSGITDLGTPKVDAMARLNTQIGLGTNLKPIQLNVCDPAAEDALATCDVIFGCTDGHLSRVVLNRLAYYHLIPLIDLGVVVTPQADGTVGVNGRVTVVGPGTACLICRNRIDLALAHAESLDPEDRRTRAAEGYVPDLEEPAPAVVTYTTLTSAVAMTTLLHRLFGIGDNRHTEAIIDATGSTIRKIDHKGRPGCFCTNPKAWGQSFTKPRLGLT